jgi:5-methyltetrahydropteroyltriglutamate--homocysteine methyltransferase
LLRTRSWDDEDKVELKRWSSRYAVRFFESAGLDVVYDGEQQRSEMYAWTVAHTMGFQIHGNVRSFDNKYYSKAAAVGPVVLRQPYHDQEFSLARSLANRELKVPVTGAYTIAAWSFDEYYGGEVDLGSPLEIRGRARREAKRSFVLDVAHNVIRPNIESLISLGARWIQLDEPAASTVPDELELVVEAFNVTVEGLNAFFSTHLCFSDYELFFPAIEQMEGCRQYAVGFANYDSVHLGVTESARTGYGIVKKFRDLPYEPAIGLGVIDIHSDFIESPELVRDRIMYGVESFGDASRVHVTPDCGLRTRSWEVSYQKLKNMVAGVEMAKNQLGL